MEYIIPIILTVIVSFAILKLVNKSEKLSSNKLLYSQSYIHNLTKGLVIANNGNEKKQTQLSKRADEKSIKIVSIEDRAYWVVDNVFYMAEMDNDMPDMSTAKPIDTSNMSRTDIDKMLFILDNLDRRKKDERGSTGNE